VGRSAGEAPFVLLLRKVGLRARTGKTPGGRRVLRLGVGLVGIGVGGRVRLADDLVEAVVRRLGAPLLGIDRLGRSLWLERAVGYLGRIRRALVVSEAAGAALLGV
jgi:hypothetical protein